MPLLFSLHLSKGRAGFGKPRVAGVNADLAGHLCTETNTLRMPKPDDVLQALPHYYRKAFERAAKRFWFPSDARTPYVHLCDSRGKYLNTLYAIPYQFPGLVPSEH